MYVYMYLTCTDIQIDYLIYVEEGFQPTVPRIVASYIGEMVSVAGMFDERHLD